MQQAYICDAIRTPIGRYAGALSSIRADDLAALPIKTLLARNPQVDWSEIDDVMLGCANQSGEDNRNVARMAALLADLPQAVAGVTLNRLCGSGLEAVGAAARAIRSGDADLMIAGGVESMSRAPFVMGKAGKAFGREHKLEDTTLGWRFVNPAMAARYGIDSMPQTGENVAREHGVSREDQDAFALNSQRKTAAAQATGRLAIEIMPIPVSGKNGAIIVNCDEHPRQTDLATLRRLKPVVEPSGTVTAGNASGINDGAAALIVSSEYAALRNGLIPRARIVAMVSAGVAPRVMGMGPVPAAKKLLTRAGINIDDVDVIELNEAFASQAIAVLRALRIDPADPRVNPNGGAIALGHPLGMSGARLALTATQQLQLSAGRRALILMCVGVGQGIAMLLEGC